MRLVPRRLLLGGISYDLYKLLCWNVLGVWRVIHLRKLRRGKLLRFVWPDRRHRLLRRRPILRLGGDCLCTLQCRVLPSGRGNF